MTIYDTPSADNSAVLSGFISVTPKYAIEFEIYELNGVYAGEVIWDPHMPSSTKQKALARKIDAALIPCLTEILQLGVLLERSSV
jgi:hypothetical protein